MDAVCIASGACGGTLLTDLDGDNCVTSEDRDLLLLLIGQIDMGGYVAILPGDANIDGRVDQLDFQIWLDNRFLPNTTWTTADFTWDQITDGNDSIELLSNLNDSIWDTPSDHSSEN